MEYFQDLVEDLSGYTGNYGRVNSLDELKKLVDTMYESGKTVSFDIETGYTGPDRAKTALDVYHPLQFIAGFALTNDVRWARYVPVRHDFGDNLDREQVWTIMKPLLEELPVVCHNVVFEARNVKALDRKGDGPSIVLNPQTYHDTMLQSYSLSETQYHGLKFKTETHYNYHQTPIHDLFDKKLTGAQMDAIRFNPLDVNNPKVVKYVCDDVTWTLRLDQYQRPKVMAERQFIYELEMAIADILIDMADVGVAVDWEGINQDLMRFDQFYQRMEVRTKRMFEEATGRDLTALNFRSHQQMRHLLFDPEEGLGLHSSRMTKANAKGEQNLSTDETALEALRQQHPAVDQLLKYRQTKKMGEFFEQWTEKFAESYDKKVHPNFKQTTVQSGRFACDAPNVQNIRKNWWFESVDKPDDFEGDWKQWLIDNGTNGQEYWGGNARNFLTASPGFTLLTFDYSQQELRVLAGLSKEPYLIDAFEKGIDIHKATAALMFGVADPNDVTDDQRARGKAQPLDARVLTPTGYRLMGDLKVGDSVIGSDGYPTKITGVFPQGVKPVYRVETTDGSTESCGEHLWTVRNATNPSRSKWVTKSLQELITSGLLAKSSSHQPKWMLPERPIVNFDPQPELPVDPYILGLLLGDGGFTHSWAPHFSSADPELLDTMRVYHASLGGTISEKKRGTEDFWTQYLASSEYFSGARNVMRNPLRLRLRELGLDNVKCDNKFVPDAYLTASPEERLSLLQGLLDTDGSVLASGAQFSSTSENLAQAVQFLARSLGGSASLNMQTPKQVSLPQGKQFVSNFPQYRVTLRLPVELSPFRLKRKAEQVSQVKYGFNLRLKSAVLVGEKECQCISVENEDGLYITDNKIVTHNTINFGNVYGQGPKALGDQLGITKDEAQALFDKYFSAFSKVAGWFEQVKKEGYNKGYTESFMGRKATVWELRSTNKAIQNKAERMFVNLPVQGGGADITKVAMVRSKRALVEKGWWMTKVRLLMNQHDSLVYEVANDLDLAEVKALLEPCVSFPIKGFPPFKVDWESGPTWGGSKKWEDAPAPAPETEEKVQTFIDKTLFSVKFKEQPTKDIATSITRVIKDHPGNANVVFVLGGDSVTLKVKVDATDALASEVVALGSGTVDVEIN